MSSRSERAVIKQVVQSNGEITINLVLTIKIEEDGVKIRTSEQSIRKDNQEKEVDLIVPVINSYGILPFGNKANSEIGE